MKPKKRPKRMVAIRWVALAGSFIMIVDAVRRMGPDFVTYEWSLGNSVRALWLLLPQSLYIVASVGLFVIMCFEVFRRAKP
jgi:hypothetical protein